MYTHIYINMDLRLEIYMKLYKSVNQNASYRNFYHYRVSNNCTSGEVLENLMSFDAWSYRLLGYGVGEWN